MSVRQMIVSLRDEKARENLLSEKKDTASHQQRVRQNLQQLNQANDGVIASLESEMAVSLVNNAASPPRQRQSAPSKRLPSCCRCGQHHIRIPEVVVSDNGPAFASAEFKDFTEKIGIRHLTTVPYHAAFNGLAERAVQTIKSGLTKQTEADLATKLPRFLFSYRKTPNDSTGASPAELMFKRQLRTQLDLLYPSTHDRAIAKQTKMKARYDVNTRPRVVAPNESVYTRLEHETNWCPEPCFFASMSDLQKLENTQKACKKIREGLEAWLGKPLTKKGGHKQDTPLSELAIAEQKAADLFSESSLKTTMAALSDATSKLAAEELSFTSETAAKVVSVIDAFLETTYPTLSKELKAHESCKADYENAVKRCEKASKVDKKEKAEADVKLKKQQFEGQAARVSAIIKQMDDAYPQIESAMIELVDLLALEHQRSANIMTELSTRLKVGKGAKKTT
ncbi:hypothetical protein SprV_0301162600 [Sparganum proliferum]